MSKFSDFGNDLYSGDRSIDFVGRRKVFYIIALVMITLAIVAPAARGGFNLVSSSGEALSSASAVWSRPTSASQSMPLELSFQRQTLLSPLLAQVT